MINISHEYGDKTIINNIILYCNAHNAVLLKICDGSFIYMLSNGDTKICEYTQIMKGETCE